jgi:hypothetical protein
MVRIFKQKSGTTIGIQNVFLKKKFISNKEKTGNITENAGNILKFDFYTRPKTILF